MFFSSEETGATSEWSFGYGSSFLPSFAEDETPQQQELTEADDNWDPEEARQEKDVPAWDNFPEGSVSVSGLRERLKEGEEEKLKEFMEGVGPEAPDMVTALRAIRSVRSRCVHVRFLFSFSTVVCLGTDWREREGRPTGLVGPSYVAFRCRRRFHL